MMKVTGVSPSATVDRYFGYAGSFNSGFNCTVRATATPLECAIEGLDAGTVYTIGAAACTPGGCSPAIEKIATTFPARKFSPGNHTQRLNVFVQQVDVQTVQFLECVWL